jgi:hypothetical protein
VSDSYRNPGAGEEVGDVSGRKKQELIAEEFGISRLMVRKILITTGDVTYPATHTIQELLASGKSKAEICRQLKMAIATLNSFLPYDKGVYNLSDVSNAAENCSIYRERKAAVDENERPHTAIVLLWCLLLIVLPIALVFSESSMNNIQSVSIISAFPIGIIMILMIWSFIKDSKKYMEEKGMTQ